MKNARQHVSRGVAAMLPVALLVRLGMPALAALVFLAVLVLAVICWIIASGERCDRVNRIMLARRGDASCLAPPPATAQRGQAPAGSSPDAQPLS
jgi:hypothetical protein